MKDLLHSSIETFYNCVEDSFDFQRAARTLSEATDDTGFVFSKNWPLLSDTGAFAYYNVPDEAVNSLIEGQFEIESHRLFKSLMLIPELTPVLRRTYLSDEDHRKTRAYKESVEPWGLHSEGVSILNKGAGGTQSCWFIRHPGQSEVDYEILATIAVLNKHLVRAMGLQRRLDALSEAVIRSNNVLDLVDFGLLLYGGDQTPVFVNKLARDICNDGDGMVLGRNGLIINDKTAQDQTEALLNSLLDDTVPKSARSGGTVSIPRLSGKRPYSLVVVPLSRLEKKRTLNADVAILLFDMAFKKTTAVKLFISSYSLTAAEAQLALALAQGNSIEEFSKNRRVSINTARTQLRSIFAKTETSRQPELIGLLLRSVAGVNLK